MNKRITLLSIFLFFLSGVFLSLSAQGVTTASMNGIVTDTNGNPLPGANIILVHIPTGTQYGTTTGSTGIYNLPNLKIGGPYKITVSYVGYKKQVDSGFSFDIGEKFRLDFRLSEKSVELGQVTVSTTKDETLNSQRTGAATVINPDEVNALPTVKRSTRDLIKLDPRDDGNYSFGGRNWLYNNISVDGSYFNNPFGLDGPAPGGQTDAEPIPYDAIQQVQVSIAPFDVREGGFTGAGVNTVTKSGTNDFKSSIYSYFRNQDFVGNKISGSKVSAHPKLSFHQSGVSASGPIIKNKLFIFANGEIVRREENASDYVADRDGKLVFGESRVRASIMDKIRKRMKDVYGYDTGPYEGYTHRTDNEKLLIKLNWNINENNNLSFRYNRLDARRDKGPHPFVLSPNNSGRGPNVTSLPFRNSGYRMNNRLNSFALELNSRSKNFSNRLFASYNRFRDYREPFSPEFPTIDIAQDGVTYTTVGEEPFSSHNILDQDVWQFTDNFSYYLGNHVLTVGSTYDNFSFFNSFNIFRNGVFFLPYFVRPIGSTFFSLDDFFRETSPDTTINPGGPIDFWGMVGKGPFKGENINVGQLAFYAQDEYLVTPALSLTFGLRVDIPIYNTKPVDNPFSRSLKLLDENGRPETVDQSKLPSATPLFSPRVGFNWDLTGDRSTQLRGGTGIFTGRLPFVWIGNVISNPGANPNLYPAAAPIPTGHNSTLAQSFDLNAMAPDFKWPQMWTTDLAFDKKLPGDMLFTLEAIYGKDINSVYVRNADLQPAQRYLPDGRPYYSDSTGNHELNPDGAGVFVIDNSNKGFNYNITAQLRKHFDNGINATISYNYLKAKNLMKTTEIASVLWNSNPVKGDPNNPQLSNSEFGQKHRIVGSATYRKKWSDNFTTSFGLFFEVGEGNRFAGPGGNRYSFTYAGDVNGDGASGNDLIYIPRNQSEINFDPYTDANGNVVSSQTQWERFNAFINQDDYLSSHRGQIADRSGALNPWYWTMDLKILQDISFYSGAKKHTFELSLDILNLPNLINSSWGVRKVATAAATTPLQLTRFNSSGAPVFNYKGKNVTTFVDDPSILSRWQMQFGVRYSFN